MGRPKLIFSHDRFLERISIQANGCWLWIGALRNSDQKYGCIQVGGRGGKLLLAHRYSYLHYIGELKDRWELVCHKCDNPSCVSPFHLFKDNQTENINDKVAKGRQGRHAKHGSLRRAYFYKCDCNLCKEYKKLKTYKQKMHERRKYLADIL